MKSFSSMLPDVKTNLTFFYRGKNVLNQKTELQRALERQKDNLTKKQLENHIAAQTPELEKVIADRAKRLQHPNEEKVSNH